MLLTKESIHFSLLSFPIGSYQCNCTIIFHKASRDAIIIDPGNDLASIEKIIAKYDLKVKEMYHTHAHFDHIGESDALRKKTGAKLCLHKEDEFLYKMLPMQGMFFGQVVGTPGPIDHYLEDEEELGSTLQTKNFLKTLHTPGHTPGSISFYSEEFGLPLLFSGDTLFENSIGRTDLPGGDSKKIIKSIKERLLTLPDETIVVAGHGPTTEIHTEKRLNPFLC